MTLFTVSRQFGAGGTEFARTLAAEIGAATIDRALLDRLQRGSDSEVLDYELPDELEAPGFFERVADLLDSASYARLSLAAHLHLLALKGPAVVLGLGSHIAFRDAPGALHLQAVGLASDRVRRVAAREKITVDAARDRLVKEDAKKREFVAFTFDEELFDANRFHLTLNLSRLPMAAAVAAARAAADRLTPDAPDGGAAAAAAWHSDRLLERRADLLLFRLALLDTYCKVRFAAHAGRLAVEGIVRGDEEKSRLLRGLAALPGVAAVDGAKLRVGIVPKNIF